MEGEWRMEKNGVEGREGDKGRRQTVDGGGVSLFESLIMVWMKWVVCVAVMEGMEWKWKDNLAPTYLNESAEL